MFSVPKEDLTDQELAALKATKTEQEWNDLRDQIKAARGGFYPTDWFIKVLAPGLIYSTAWYKRP